MSERQPIKLVITDEVVARLGVSAHALAQMTLADFSDLVFARGLRARVSPIEEAKSGEGHLTIQMAREQQANPPARHGGG